MKKRGESQFDFGEAAESNPTFEEHLDAVTTLAHGTHEDPWAEGGYGMDLPATRTHVNPRDINLYGGHTQERVSSAVQGYRDNPQDMPPVLLVQRGKWPMGDPKYEVADGSHRTRAALRRGMKKLDAVVVQSPHDYEHPGFEGRL